MMKKKENMIAAFYNFIQQIRLQPWQIYKHAWFLIKHLLEKLTFHTNVSYLTTTVVKR